MLTAAARVRQRPAATTSPGPGRGPGTSKISAGRCAPTKRMAFRCPAPPSPSGGLRGNGSPRVLDLRVKGPVPRETQASIVTPSARSAAEIKVPRWMTVPARTDRRPNSSDAKAPVRSIWRKPRSGVNGVGAASGWLARARTGLPRARQHRQCAAPSTIARTGLAAAPFALSYGLSVGLGASGWQPGGPTTCCPRRIERPNAHTGCRISSSLERPVLPTAVSHQLSPSSRTRQREV